MPKSNIKSCLKNADLLAYALLFALYAPHLPAFENSQDLESTGAKQETSKLSLMTLAHELTPVSNYRGDLLERSTLLGDVGGKRQELYEKGIALDAGMTLVPQGVASGGKEKGWKFSGSADYYLFLDSGRLNLWPGGLLGIHVETKFGRSVIPTAGTISPVNTDYLWPSPGQKSETFLSEYYLYQGLTDELVAILGRVNWVGVADKNPFANSEKTQFLNMSLRNTTLLGAFFPLSAHGISFAYQPSPNLLITPFIVSQSDEPGVYGAPEGLFDEVTAGAEVDIFWKLSNLPGGFRTGAGIGTKDVTSLENDYLAFDIIKDIEIPKKSDNWIVNLNFSQYLYKPEHSDAGPQTADFKANPEGIGVFFRFAFTPEDRNPWNMFVSGGIGGRGVIPGRPHDRYGFGLYSMIVSDELREQPLIGNLDTEWGLEAFYNIAITPWLQLTPDIQYIQSGLPSIDDSVVVATRIQMYF